MKSLKYILIIILGIVGYANGQQLPQYTQYMFNDFALNPAIAGTHEYYQIRSNNRFQWIGIDDAPRTYVLSVYGPHKKYDMGFGGTIFNDITGPTARTGLYGTYSYNIRIQRDLRISFGLSAGLLQYKTDGSKIILHDLETDPSLGSQMYVNYLPDATFGLYLYADDYHFGVTANQLMGNRINFSDLEHLKNNNLKRHYYITGGYKYQINKDFTIEPTLLVKIMTPTPTQIELNAKVTYIDMVWLGASFRSSLKMTDALAFLVGYNFENQMYFGYSYEMAMSNIQNYSTGSHELMIGVRFNKIKKTKSRPKIQ